jgi:hypothetical protein
MLFQHHLGAAFLNGKAASKSFASSGTMAHPR